MKKNKCKYITIITIITVFAIIIPIFYSKYTSTTHKSITLNVSMPSYTINFNTNGGTGSMPSQTLSYGETDNLTTNTFTRKGYRFIEWNTQSDGTGTSYTDSQSISNLSTTNGGIVILYAQWERIMAENIEYNEDEVNCEDAQCMIDELYYMLY